MTDRLPPRFEPVAVGGESTVVAQYEADPAEAAAYQSEAALEAAFIRQLEAQAYEYLPLHTEDELVTNLRSQLERLNDLTFSDGEWDSFFRNSIAGENDSIADKTVRIQEDHIQILERDDGTAKNVRLIDKANIHNNRLQVVNQYAVAKGEGGAGQGNRYDVTVLVNGLPLVHIELKRRGVDIREAFNQIHRYQRESFWAGSGLFEYVQLFVISNGTLTKYYSNTTRSQHLEQKERSRKAKRGSHSFEFTSWWADATNQPIRDLPAFTKTFFAKHTLLNLLTRYCVLTVDRTLLAMRPYQIVATEKILRKVEISTNARTLGRVDAGGYVWHTTGSGKTLTSFKAAQLATGMETVDKVLFVVDRKDLDYQTMREYDRFEKGAANSNQSTAELKRQLGDPQSKIIITTIQKLARFVQQNEGHPVYDQHVVIIFDECHRSQFGEMHTAITKRFKRYNLFGFTGTPIFAANAMSGGNPQLKTTEQAFGEKLHTYTIVDAISDKNVLPFRIDYISTVKSGLIEDEEIPAIDREKALLDPERVSQVTAYILKHFNQKTRRNDHYTLKGRRLHGFNALFATASISAACTYYEEFRKQQKGLTPDQRLKVGMIYSFAPNPDPEGEWLGEEGFDAESLVGDARSYLESAIADYNETFGFSFDTSAGQFENYYKDLSQKLRDREIDLVIVVNMFLTGFDATTLNTLFVDKSLRSHGLIQAFSRTNRILNAVKSYGNIVSFRNLEQRTNEALELFGNKDAKGIVILKPYGEYYSEYASQVAEMLERFPEGEYPKGETAQKEFIELFGRILRLRNILVSFDEFEGGEILSPRQQQDYHSVYLEIYKDFRTRRESEPEAINDDLVFEIELIKQVEINVDYILMLVEKARREQGDGEDREIRAQISRAVDASPTLRSKKDLIEDFVAEVSPDGRVEDEWQQFIRARRDSELNEIIEQENLNPDQAHAFVEAAFRDGEIQTAGTAVTKILPPVSLFTPDGQRAQKKAHVLERLLQFFERFFGLIGGGGSGSA